MNAWMAATLWAVAILHPVNRRAPAAPDLAGYYAVDTQIGDAAAKMAFRFTHVTDGYAVTVYPAMGGPVQATDVKVDGKRVTMVAMPHGMKLAITLTIDGDKVSGTWLIGGNEGTMTGARAPDPQQMTTGSSPAS